MRRKKCGTCYCRRRTLPPIVLTTLNTDLTRPDQEYTMLQPNEPQVQKLLEALLSRPDGAVVAAKITVFGMLGSAFLAALIQWLITKTLIRSQLRREKVRLDSEFRVRQYELWQNRFHDALIDLLTATDPQVNPVPAAAKIVPQVHRVQLLLSRTDPAHKKVTGLVNELALTLTGWREGSAAELMGTHAALIEAAKDIFYSPHERAI